MLKVDNKMEELFLSDSVPKNLTIDVEGELDTSLIPLVNFYTGDIFDNAESTLTFDSWNSFSIRSLYCNLNPKSTNLSKYQVDSFYSYKKYIWVTFDFMIEPTDTNYYAPNPGYLYVSYKKLDSEVHESVLIKEDFSKYVNNWETLTFVIPASNVKYLDCLQTNHNDSTPAKNIKLHIKNIQIRLSDNSSSAPQYVKSVSADGIDIDDYINGNLSITNSNLIQESFSLTESLCSQDNLKFGLCESAHCEFEVVGRSDKFIGKTIRPYINIAGEPKQNRIPLGVFKVTDVKKNHTHDIIKKSITAYDNMSILDQDVGDWLTKYMWITDTANKACSDSPHFTKFGVEYVRQLFPTFANIMKRIGVISDTDFNLIWEFSNIDVPAENYDYGYNYIWKDYPSGMTSKYSVGLLFGASVSAGHSTDRLLRVDLTPVGGKTDEELFGMYARDEMLTDWGANYHGFPSCASVFIIMTDSKGYEHKVLADSGDYVFVSTDIQNIEIYYSAGICITNAQSPLIAAGDSSKMLTAHFKASYYELPELFSGLVNAHQRLVYYNYGTQELGSFSSSVSARDVVRSLLEVNGCFFHMNRYGKPEIIYASKAGLYPSEKLYPREDLYPRGMNGPLLSMNKYISMECDDYVVENYGKIQIKTQSRVKNGESICSYEYIGNPDGKNTYIIEDNIFYCAEGTVYEYGSQPEVDEMLKNLFDKISNLTYTPHTTKLRGLPFMECGDRVNLVTKTGGIESFIFRRTLKGIHALMDRYEASGDEYNEALNTFDYKVYTPT